MKKRLASLFSLHGWHLTLGALFIFSVFAFISIKTPLAGDDWGYAINGSQNNPFTMAYAFYFSWSGRFFSELYGFLITPHKWVWNSLNPILFTAIFITLTRFIPSKRQPLTLLIILFLMLSVKDDLRMETYSWLMGTTYVIPLFLSLWVFLQLKYMLLDQKILSTPTLGSMALSVILIGLMMENSAAIMSFVLMGSILIFRITRGRFSKSLGLITALSVLSLVILRLSPGAHFRLVRDSADWINLGLFNQLKANYPTFIQLTFIDHRYVVLTMSALLMWKTFKQENAKRLFKIPLIVVFGLAMVSSMALTLSTVFTHLNLDWMIEPNSIYNQLFWIIYSLATYFTVWTTLSLHERFLGLFFVTIAGLSNGIMMLSPIFGYRSSLYTVYYLISFIAILFQTIHFNLRLRLIGLIVMVILLGKTTQTYIYKYSLVSRVEAYRLSEIAYYQTHPNEDAWIIRFPIYTVHGGDIEPDDSYHMDVFKAYYHLNPNQKLIFYFPDESYEDFLIKNGY